MPGSAGFSVMAKAQLKRHIVGGVVADSIGAGKTVISIAIIQTYLRSPEISQITQRFWKYIDRCSTCSYRPVGV